MAKLIASTAGLRQAEEPCGSWRQRVGSPDAFGGPWQPLNLTLCI